MIAERNSVPAPAAISGLRRWLVLAGPDLVILTAFTLVFLVLLLIYGADLHLKEGAIILPACMAVGLGIVTFVVGERATYRQRLREVLRDWAPFIALNLVYENLRMYTGLIRPVPIDGWLDRADRALFGGVAPVLWMKHVQTPVLTDFMSLAYGLYFILPLCIIGLLYWRRRRADFRELALALVL